mgnify:FL=1
MQYYELSDDRYLGIDLIEIVSFPALTVGSKTQEISQEKNAKEFVSLISEIYRLSGSNICLELLWLTEKVENQTIASRIRIFFVFRLIGNRKDDIAYKMDNQKKNIIVSLAGLHFGVRDDNGVEEAFYSLLNHVDDSCVYSAVKSEKCIGNATSLYPYYFCDVLPNNNTSNFNSLISSLSQQEYCCVSFQLFPTSFSEQEAYMINEVSGELSRIASGTMINRELYKDEMANEPLKTYKYYNEKRNSPLFLYNILVFGKREACASVASKVISLLQSGEEKISTISPVCLDLTGEGISLKKQFSYYTWNVNARLLHYYRNKKLQETVPLAKNLYRMPYIVTADEAESFFRLPLYEKTMVALKSNQVSQAQEQFSSSVVRENNIHIGKLKTNDVSQIVIGCPEKAFTKHALVVGTPGSGKTTFSVDILLQFARKNIPFLAIEPTKAEYRGMIDAVPGLRVFTPGNNSVSPFIINPFIPPKGIRIEQYIPSLASAFKAAFSMPSPLDMIFLKAIRSCYTQFGWKDYSMVGDPDVTPFGLYEFIVVFKKLIDNTNYSKDVRGNIESAGLLRLTNLIEQNSNIYDSINTVPIEDLLTAPTVLELNSIDNSEQKSLLMALLLINICVYTKHNHIGDGELKNVILIDEAHVLLGGGASVSKDGAPDSQGTTIKALQDMIAEIRSYGTSIIIADQSPTKVSREVVANTDIKISFRLTQSVEKELIADSTNMDEDAQSNLSRLTPGEAYVYYSQLESPQLVITEDVREKEGIRLSVSNVEVANRETYWKQHQKLLKPYKECEACLLCKEGCQFKTRADAEYIANSAFERYRGEIKGDDDFRKVVYHLPEIMKKEFEKYIGEDRLRIQICSRIKLLRKIQLELPVKISEKDKSKVLTSFPEKKEGE